MTMIIRRVKDIREIKGISTAIVEISFDDGKKWILGHAFEHSCLLQDLIFFWKEDSAETLSICDKDLTLDRNEYVLLTFEEGEV